jgi:hypothetical protein
MLRIQRIDRPFFGVLCALTIGVFVMAAAMLSQNASQRTAPAAAETTQRYVGDREEKATLDRRTLLTTEITAAILFLQLIVFGYQALKLRQTVKAGNVQSEC